MYTTYYSEKYSQHIEHMILVSPAGVNSSGLKSEDLNWFIKFVSQLYITPMVSRCGCYARKTDMVAGMNELTALSSSVAARASCGLLVRSGCAW